jgi:signal peptidase I
MSDLTADRKKRPWLGVVLSLLVPGFGLLRAGLPGRALAWFVGLEGLRLGAAFGFVFAEVPFGLAVGFVAVAALAPFWMLWDSYRPGRLRPWLWALWFVLFAALVWLPPAAELVLRGFRVPTGSMEPTLMGPQSADGADHVIANSFSYLYGTPKRGDVIVFRASLVPGYPGLNAEVLEKINVFSRVVGLPGERIRIADGKLFADGRLLGRGDGIPQLHYSAEPKPREGEDFVVGAGEYFVIGDNSERSLDSRYWGGVPAAAIYGKVTRIYYPLTRAGDVGAVR